ncbi:RNA-binding protein 34 isoform X2 [Trichechus manatus latirostris]|uniref:RNA-binding protein 34 n=1 Tax=Trichechus manatus latirostris TaxID=127582 RepID=A0A2Y9QK14_TRIMA|nr:RNA-binding protein 34 isoform X2 [Trichechus manatus latirostris]
MCRSSVGSLGIRMALEVRNKRKKKKNAEQRENPDDSFRGNLTGDYLVGQVANSLFHSKRLSRGNTDRLASLFSSFESPVKPVYVPVPKEATKKRKQDEVEEITPQIQKPHLQEPAKKKVKKKLSDADKKLANRESALACADLEEEEIHQEHGQKRRSSQSGGGVRAADTKVPNNVDHIVVNQRKKIQVNQEEERLKNERTVFVGNLPVTCNKKKLKSFFKQYGQIESVRFRSLIPAEGTLSKKLAAIKRKIHPDQKNINAYVVFKDESAATKALKRNGTQIADGFRIRVDLASESSSRDKRSVFVGNLPYKIEESAVEEHFLDCGSIVAVRIVRDQVTGVGKGFGYVLFENTDAVHLALKLNNSELMGRKLRVMRSVNKEKLKQQNSNPGLKNVSKPKQGLNFASKHAEGQSKSLFIGEKAVLTKKKKKGQKRSGRPKKQKKQK